MSIRPRIGAVDCRRDATPEARDSTQCHGPLETLPHRSLGDKPESDDKDGGQMPWLSIDRPIRAYSRRGATVSQAYYCRTMTGRAGEFGGCQPVLLVVGNQGMRLVSGSCLLTDFGASHLLKPLPRCAVPNTEPDLECFVGISNYIMNAVP